MLYFEIGHQVTKFFEIYHGTIQGSILGPILYAIYVSTLFDITNLSNFADNNYALTWSKSRLNTIILMEERIKIIKKRLTDLGLKVNDSKYEFCLFYHKDPPDDNINNNISIVH